MTPHERQLLLTAVKALDLALQEDSAGWDRIVAVVEKHTKDSFNFSRSLVQGKRKRTDETKSWVRFVVIYLCVKEFGVKQAVFTPRYALRSSVTSYALRVVEERLTTSPQFAQQVWNIKAGCEAEILHKCVNQTIPLDKQENRRGFHSHTCPRKDCRTKWTHSEFCSGDTEAHDCPNCGEVQLYKDTNLIT